MFSKLLKRKSMPENDGTKESTSLEKREFVKVFQLVLSNMENTPVYDLKHQLTVGSEIGNIIIADPSLSPRHATFVLQQEVVSVVDHASIAGTMVNGKLIDAGKYIILDESDVITMGELEIRLKVGMESKPVEEIPEIPKVELETKKEEKKVVAKAPIKNTNKRAPKKQLQKKVSVATLFGSTNAVVRVFAVLCDFLLSYSILTILQPFDEFRALLDFIPSFIETTFDLNWATLGATIVKEAGFAGEMLQDGFVFLSNTLHLGPLLLVFALNRIITTLFFGVSLSEYCLGVRTDGNKIWIRVGGVLRVLLGLITGPFLIFDTPAIISRRTLKELLSFTNTYVPRKVFSILGIIFLLPALCAFALISPLMQGLESPEAIVINDVIDQKVKVKVAGDVIAAAPEVSETAKSIGLSISYNPEELALIPGLEFRGVKNKLNLRSSLYFYQKDLKRVVELEVFKKFDMQQLLGIGMKGNVFLFDKYPEIYKFVYQSKDSNPAFKTVSNPKTQLAFANEFIQFTKVALALNSENALETLETETFLVKGLVDYKASLLSLLEYKNFHQINFIKIGGVVFMKIEYKKDKPFDLIIPLVKGEGRVYKVNFDKNEELELTASKFYKYNLENTKWEDSSISLVASNFRALDVYDLLSSADIKQKLESAEYAQALYGFYFEYSSNVLKRTDVVETNLWVSQLKSLVKLFEAIAPENAEGHPVLKLIQNFKDLEDAVENKNYEYFGLTGTTAV